MPIRNLTVTCGFDAIESRWRQAQTTCAGYGFQSFDWLQTWQRTLGDAQGWAPYLVALVEREELTESSHPRTLMLLPLGIRRRRGVRTLAFLGGEVTDYNTGLFDPAFAATLEAGGTQMFTQLWQQVLAALPAVDLIRLRRMPETIDAGHTTVRNPYTSLAAAIANENAYAATLPETFAAFQQPRSAKMFADTRRQARRLAGLGTVRIAIDETGPARAAVIEAMARQKSRRWQQTASRDLFAEPGYLAFYQALAADGLAGGAVLVSALYVDGCIVATHWGIRYGQRLYWLMPGYEVGEWERYSSGRILLDAVVQWAITEKLALFDLTVGEEAYKQQWSDQRLALYALNAARTPLGSAILGFQAAVARLRDWAKRQAWLRQAVIRFRAWLRARLHGQPH